jgi:hypothetical protein
VREQQTYNTEWQRPIGSFMSHEAQSSKYKHNMGGPPGGGPPANGMGGGGGNMNPMGGMGMGMNPMGGMGSAMGGAGGMGNPMGGAVPGFDPTALAAMYQKLMMSEFARAYIVFNSDAITPKT